MTAELVLVAALCFAVAVAGGSVGLVLGNIRLPAVLLISTSAAAGAGANIGISALAAGTASIAHVRAGRVHRRLFWVMVGPSVAGALAGGYLSGLLPEPALLLVIAAALLYFGVDTFRSHAQAPRPRPVDYRAAAVAGLGIGLMGGVVGLILGALRMPALLRWVGAAPEQAVGTNLAVGFCLGVAGVIGHLPEGVDWDVLAVGGAASVPGALLGARLTGRLSREQLLRAIGVILVVAAAGVLAQGLSRL